MQNTEIFKKHLLLKMNRIIEAQNSYQKKYSLKTPE
jgi:hypothetical protein